MAEGIVFSVLGKIGEYLVAPIGRQFGYLFCYNNNIENLRGQAKKLKDIKDGVQLSVSTARNNLEVIATRVESWLIEVENITTKSDRIFEDKASIVDKGCLNRWCPNPKTRYFLSREASKQAQVIVELRSEGEHFNKVSYPAPPTGRAESSVTGGSKGLQSRMSIVKEIIDALKNDNIAVIGIWGMGGVGKTIMVEEIAKRAKSEKKIDEFAMAVVSQNVEVIKIQSELAEMLGLKFEEQISIFARAQRLRERLMNGNRILVILDDVWEGLDMGKIGIPIKDERKGCKVVLTSRNTDVCSQMGTQKNFAIEVLSEHEAWCLFKEMAGNCVDADDVRHIAEEVAKECGGLPLALVTIAKALKNKKKHFWDNALKQLRKSTVTNITGMHKLVYSRIELSYNYLESEQARSLLLLCCLFQEDEEIPIEVLVRYGVGLELFESIDTLAETRNMVDSLVDELRSSSLLLGEDESVFVKMHDVIRDVCLSIASKEEHGYIVRHDKSLKEWPQKDKHSPHTAISLYSNEMEELPAGLDCPNLKLLRFVGALRKLEISGDAFEGMKELKVVTFGVDGIKPQPTSFKFLSNLRTLCLENCGHLGDLSFIGGLQKLEILSFFNSNDVVLPSEAGELSNLRLLDFRCWSISREHVIIRIPSGVLSHLRKLEELYMGNHVLQDDDQENCASITELNSLSCLKRLQIQIPSGNEVLSKLKDFQFQNLIKYDFSMQLSCYGYSYFPNYELRENSLSLNEVDRTVLLENNNINGLIRRSKKLFLQSVRELKNVVKDLDEEEGFVHLETLVLYKCGEVEYVMDDAEICGRHGTLRERSSESERRHLSRDPIQPPSPLVNLRVLEVYICHAMKSLFKKSVVKCLVQLQELRVWSCDMLEGIVLAEGREENKETRDKIVLPKLNFLVLNNLRNFRSFMHSTGQKEENFGSENIDDVHTEENVGSGEDNLGSENIDDVHATQLIFTQQVLLPNLEKLVVQEMKNRVLLTADEMRDGPLHNLKKVTVLSCEDMESIFDFERLKTGRVVLGQLELVNIRSMDKLIHIWRMVPRGIQGFHSLRKLEVWSCNKLRYLLSPLVAKMVVNLQQLELRDCGMIEQVIRTEEEEKEEEEEDISEINMMDKIIFPQLQVLHLVGLKNLRMFCISKHDFELPLLESVDIKNCPNMKTFCSGQLIMPKLERVRIDGAEVFTDQSRWKGDLNSTLAYLSARREDSQDSSE